MQYVNTMMADYLKNHQEEIKKSIIDASLISILDEGFINICGCTFLKLIFPSNYDIESYTIEKIIESYQYLSGFEFFENKFHFDVFTNKNLFIQAFLFLEAFKNKWYKEFKDERCVVFISFQNDDVGKFATFRFHKKRLNEDVIDHKLINEFMQPVYMEII